MTKDFRYLERIIRGISSHRRIEILELLATRPNLDLMTIAKACGTRFRNASEHVKRMAIAGLVTKRQKGRHVLHSLSPRGRYALRFIEGLA